MNKLELLCDIKEVVSSNGDKESFLMKSLKIDGKVFHEKFALDMNELTDSCCYDGEFEILTCGCGDAGCAGIDEGIQVSHRNGTVIWKVRNPINWPINKDLPKTFKYMEYVFEKKQYVEALRNGVNEGKLLLRDAEENDEFVQTSPHGFTTYDFFSLKIRPAGLCSPNVNKALELSAKAHLSQIRKGTDIPYITHPYAVGMILLNAGCSEEIVIAGILHDTVEDTVVTLDDIKAELGDEVAKIVAGCSEPDKDLCWEERKQHTIDELKSAPLEIQFVACADKLHNISTMIEEHQRIGDELWTRFKRGKEEQGWYYRGLLDSLSRGPISCEPIYKEFKLAVESLFGEHEKHNS